MQASHPQLPLELCDTIIDILGEDLNSTKDTASLRACLFVSRAFRHRARSILFKTIRIGDVTSKECVNQSYQMRRSDIHHRSLLLVDIVDPSLADSVDVLDGSAVSSSGYSSGILPYIREVHISFNANYSMSLYTPLSNDATPFSSHRLRSLHYGIAIIKMLTIHWQACSLHLLKITSFGGQADWARLAPGIRSSLLDLCRVSTLHTIQLDRMINVPRDILRGTFIDRLVLGYVHLYDRERYNRTHIDVELFPEYDNETAGTESVLARLPFPDLKHAVIKDVYDTIKSASVAFNTLYPTSPKTPCLSMKSMELEIQNRDQINRIFNLLQVGAKFPNLESLSLKCIHSTHRLSIIPNWDAVQRDIQSPFPSLKTLGIDISPNLSTGPALFKNTKDGSRDVDYDLLIPEINRLIGISQNSFPGLQTRHTRMLFAFGYNVSCCRVAAYISIHFDTVLPYFVDYA